MGLLYPSNLHSLLPSSWPRGQHGPTQRAWPAGPKLPRNAADRWKLLGARPWRPPGIASTSVRLLIFQAKVCCWFLSPLVPTLPGTYLLT